LRGYHPHRRHASQQVARVCASDEKTAIAKAIEEAGITNPQLQAKLAARHED